MKVAVGIEPTYRSFADFRLTTWLRRQKERETRFELATSTLARWSSTTELFPQKRRLILSILNQFVNEKLLLPSCILPVMRLTIVILRLVNYSLIHTYFNLFEFNSSCPAKKKRLLNMDFILLGAQCLRHRSQDLRKIYRFCNKRIDSSFKSF